MTRWRMNATGVRVRDKDLTCEIFRDKNKTKQAVPIKSKPPPEKFSKFIRQYTANYFILLQLLTEQAGPPRCRRHFRGIAGISSLMPLRTRSWHPNPHPNALERKIPLFCLFLTGSLWHKGAYNRTFPCMEATYPYFLMHKWAGAALLSTNESHALTFLDQWEWTTLWQSGAFWGPRSVLRFTKRHYDKWRCR